MTEAEQIREQEMVICRLRAERAELSARVTKLQAMHNASQRHIQTLQRALKANQTTEAEKVFSK